MDIEDDEVIRTLNDVVNVRQDVMLEKKEVVIDPLPQLLKVEVRVVLGVMLLDLEDEKHLDVDMDADGERLPEEDLDGDRDAVGERDPEWDPDEEREVKGERDPDRVPDGDREAEGERELVSVAELDLVRDGSGVLVGKREGEGDKDVDTVAAIVIELNKEGVDDPDKEKISVSVTTPLGLKVPGATL
jgi:hypothetical protein